MDMPEIIQSATLVTDQNRDTLLRNKPIFFRLLVSILNRLSFGTLVLVLPDGQKLKFSSPNEIDQYAIIKVRDYAVARRVLLGGIIGFTKATRPKNGIHLNLLRRSIFWQEMQTTFRTLCWHIPL